MEKFWRQATLTLRPNGTVAPIARVFEFTSALRHDECKHGKLACLAVEFEMKTLGQQRPQHPFEPSASRQQSSLPIS
jgi:hypothetical protein